jgi:GNAT superfamily N-acetyltransferase
MTDLQIETVFDPPADSLAQVDRGLHEFNLTRLGEGTIHRYHRVAVFARDGDGTLIGGIHGELFWDWLHIDTLWVHEAHRRQGIATRLLMQIEAAAAAKGGPGLLLQERLRGIWSARGQASG